MSFVVIGVNCFILISGYFGIKFRVKSLISFVVQALFYSITIFLIFKFTTGTKYNGDDSYFKTLTPITSGKWWFLSRYLSLFLISPILNKGLDAITKNQHLFIIAILVLFELSFPIVGFNVLGGDGTSLYSFITLYIIARYLYIYNISVWKPGLMYLTSSACLFAIALVLIFKNQNMLAWNMYAYSSIFVIMGAITFLYIFKNISIKPSKTINRVASLTFGVYLIHDHRSIRFLLKEKLSPMLLDIDNMGVLLVALVATTLIIFLCCLIIEQGRVIICTPIVNFIDKKIKLILPADI